MAATRRIVDDWIDRAKKLKAKFILSVCDSWDYDDYPIFCKTEKELKAAIKSHNNVNMQRINELITVVKGKVTENVSYIKYMK